MAMELIRRDTDYAVRALLHLALAPENPASREVVAEACDIPKSYAHKILKKLANAGFVSSCAGRRGGYRLEMAPTKITLNDVISAVQGPVVINRCVVDPSSCDRSSDCHFTSEWKELQHNVVDFLVARTLQDVVDAAEAAGAVR